MRASAPWVISLQLGEELEKGGGRVCVVVGGSAVVGVGAVAVVVAILGNW